MQSSMNNFVNNFSAPESNVIQSHQMEIMDIRKKNELAETANITRPRKVTLASVDAKLDLLIRLLTDN